MRRPRSHRPRRSSTPAARRQRVQVASAALLPEPPRGSGFFACAARTRALPDNRAMPSTAPASAPDDPMPQPPQPPALEDCCGNGCNPCVFDLHDLAMDEYRQALRAWRSRQPAPGLPTSAVDKSWDKLRPGDASP